MFTGIIEALGIVEQLVHDKQNIHLTISSPISHELKIDQSVSHNGVCLTVIDVQDNKHTVTAIDETLRKTNIGQLQPGNKVNLERCTLIGGRLDGHIVQGHVDQTAECIAKQDANGSWLYTFRYTPGLNELVVEKGSICINGISLTAFNTTDNTFSVAVIPYTYHHTNIAELEPGKIVNLEFDIIGKYVARIANFQKSSLG